MLPKRDISITPRILEIVSEIEEFKGSWRTLTLLSPERLSALRRVATIESIGSSTRIEGSHMSDRDVERLLSNLRIESFESRDEQEVAGYAHVMELVFRSWEDLHPTENHILQLHRDLIQFSEKDAHHRGKYKTSSNSVAAFDELGNQIGIVFETASPFETPGRMEELVTWIDQVLDSGTTHSLLAIAVFIVAFLAIHPFQDGNGRLSRILTTLLLLRAGYAYVPYCSLESIVEADKEGYYLALRRTQVTIQTANPDWEPWILYFLGALRMQTRRLSEKIEHERIVFTNLPELSVHILEMARDHGRVTMGDVIRSTGVSRNTLKEHFRQLQEEGHLKMHGAGRGAWYSLG